MQSKEAIESMRGISLEHDVYYDPTLVCNSGEQVRLDSGGLDKFHQGRVLVIKYEKVTPEYSQVY
jgi:hypothetical protein